jgi:hypothetical protein
LDPEHLELDGRLSSAAVSLDDIEFRGWSVDRKKFTSIRQLKLFHQSWKERKPNINRFYVVPINVKDIRSNCGNGPQVFVVTDAAVCNKPCHAAVLLSTTGKRPKSELRQFRTELLEKLPRYVEVDQVYNPIEKYGYVWGMFIQSMVFLVSLRRLRSWRCLFFPGR